jgi:putative DNA-invertase from lambdoid prophage Rac
VSERRIETPASSGQFGASTRVRTAIYARVSTEDQDGSSQLSRLRDWAKAASRVVALEEVDKATGKNIRRPGLERIMAEARGHHVRCIATCRVDRWARSARDLSNTLHELHQLGIEWIAIDQGIHISTERDDPTTRLQLNIFGAVAEWEGSIISERTRQALAFLKSGGKRLGRPPGSKDRRPRSNKGYLARYADKGADSEGGTP